MVIIECQCCVYDKKNDAMGMPPEEDWVPFAFKLKEVVSIRQPKEEKDQTIVYFGFDSFWIDIPYMEFLPIFKDQE